MLAVTTHNKLRSWRFCLPMLRARRHVKEQLATMPGLIRQVTAITSPTEFSTLTVWESRQAMFNFMSSGAHEAFMWMFARWSASFWSMRWLPTTAETGTWDGLALSSLTSEDELPWRPQPPRLPLPASRPLHGPGARPADPTRSGVYATTALVESSGAGQLWQLMRTTRRIRRNAQPAPILRCSLGAIDRRRFLVVMLWGESSTRSEGTEELADMATELHRHLNARWTMCWAAGEYEIGHWDNLRLRQIAVARARKERQEASATAGPASAITDY